jgi:probable O-glycosylation ligase (exosortase A-associated)
MRDFLVVGVFGFGVLLALRRQWIGVMLWTWISVMNPHSYCFGFARTAPLAAVAAVVALLGLLTSRERQNPMIGKPLVWLLLFMAWMTLSWFLGYGRAGGKAPAYLSLMTMEERDFDMWKRVMKTFLMLFVTLAILKNKYQIQAFIWVAAMSLGLLGAKGGVYTILTGGSGRVDGPAGSFIGDNNDFALALIVTIPILYVLQLHTTRKWIRRGVIFTMFLCGISALGSHSRGGLLALGAMLTVMWWRSQSKVKMALVFIVLVPAILSMMPAEWWERMGTITEAGGDASFMGRVRSWKVAIQIAMHEVTGAGMVYLHPIIFQMWDYDLGPDQGMPLASHSIYFQILGNHGFIGLFLYLMIGVTTYSCARWLRVNARKIPEAKWAADLGSMVQVGMVGFAVGGALLPLAYADIPFNMMAMVVLARHWVETKGWERDPQMSFGEYCWSGRRKQKHSHTRGQEHAPGRASTG